MIKMIKKIAIITFQVMRSKKKVKLQIYLTYYIKSRRSTNKTNCKCSNNKNTSNLYMDLMVTCNSKLNKK